MLPKRKSGLEEMISLMLIKYYVRPLRLKYKATKTKDSTDIRNYKKQWNYVVNLNKEAKLEYFSNYESNVSEPFWVNCKPYFTNKHSKAGTDIILSEHGELILKIRKIVNTFNDHFASIVDNLGLDDWDDHSLSPTMGSDRIDNVKEY